MQEAGSPSLKDMGAIMKTIMARFAGRTVDGKRVSDLVRARLQS
ncbi:MAG TPA: GatB/YqeY domain-containing protein [Nitrospiraceae bacterium]|nr:GatB/YqeY domain-containing protein [Nitrospiraceae bacterium]